MSGLQMESVELSVGSAHFIFECECGGSADFEFQGNREEALKIAESKCDYICLDMEGTGD